MPTQRTRPHFGHRAPPNPLYSGTKRSNPPHIRTNRPRPNPTARLKAYHLPAIFSGKIKTVIVWKLDRISRRLKDGINLLSDWCSKDIRVISITQAIDLSGAVGRMIAAVMLGLAEIELEFRQQRQMAGIEVARERGVYKGRKQGTTKAAPVRAQELRARGLKIKEIATALGTSTRTVQRYLRVA